MLTTNDPKVLGIAFLGGIIPALFWLWFWLREDKEKPEPKGILTICFILGAAAVILVLPIQKFIQTNFSAHTTQVILWASVEEIMKYLAMILILYKSKYIEEPIDYAIYIITVALGFAAFENMLFLIKPLSLDQTIVGLLTGQLRFLGSTLLHSVSSGIIGIFLGLSFFMNREKEKLYLFLGIILAIALHSTFNFFIIEIDGNDFLKVLQVFAFLWVVTIIVMLLFEKVRRMN